MDQAVVEKVKSLKLRLKLLFGFGIIIIAALGLMLLTYQGFSLSHQSWSLSLAELKIIVQVGESFLVMSLAFLFLGFGWALLISSAISRPVQELVAVVEEMAQGNIGKKIKVDSRDELGIIASSFNDITNVMELYRITLEQNRARDQAILAAVGDGVFAINKAGKMILFNQAAAQMSGFAEREALGKSYLEVFQFTVDQFLQDALGGKKAQVQNMGLVMKKTGRSILVEASASPLQNKTAETLGCIVIFRDVTKERRIDRMKTEFISLASHQLKTPLSAVRWFSEMLLNGDAGKLSAQQREFIDNIDQSNKRMIALVDALLNISRIESGRIMIEPELTDLAGLVQGVVDDLRARIHEKDQSLVISVHKGLPKISIDPRLIRNVYMNLLTNAVKYSPEKGEISVFISRKGSEVISQISDSGLGIPRGEQDRIFQRFFRATNIVKVETDGTGLGLYLARAIVESSGGRIWFKSMEGEGTTFWFSLPLSGTPPKAGEVTIDS